MLHFDTRSRIPVRLALTACLTMAHAGCDPGTLPTCTTDVPHVTHDGSTIVFAMTSLVIDPTDNPDEPHTGFDLDGFASGDVDPDGCAHADYLSILDPESNCSSVRNEHCAATSVQCSCAGTVSFGIRDGGRAPLCFGSIDNQLPTVANTIQTALNVDIRMSVADDVARGRLVVLARVTGVDAFDEDPEVHVQLLNGFAAPGTSCSTPRQDGVYQVSRASLRAGGMTEADGAVDIVGSIHGGRLRAIGNDTQAFTITFQLAAAPFQFELRHPVVAADVGPDGGVRGNFGGWVAGDALVAQFTSALPEYAAYIPGIVGGLIDVSINSVCSDQAMSPSRFGGMSFGMGFDMVRVSIDSVNPVIDTPAPGTCAAPGDARADGG